MFKLVDIFYDNIKWHLASKRWKMRLIAHALFRQVEYNDQRFCDSIEFFNNLMSGFIYRQALINNINQINSNKNE